MADKKYQVFISSTYLDLIEERRNILEILLMADCIPAGMEAFVATDNEQFEVIKRVIDLCDYYILIIGKRYGSVNSSTGMSYTEMEYDYAIEQSIPVLVFAIDEDAVLPDAKIESESDMIEKLSKFRKKAMDNRLAKIWKTPDELSSALAISIMRAKNEISRSGWQKATDYDEASLRREIMELEEENKRIIEDLKSAQQTIHSFTEQSNLAFEDCTIKIDYYRNRIEHGYTRRDDDSVNVNLSVLFTIIATEMMDVSITEEAVSRIIKSKCLPSRYTYYFSDSQLIKRIIRQLTALNLIYSYWSKEKSTLFWSLTQKGIKERDDRILIRETSEDKQN